MQDILYALAFLPLFRERNGWIGKPQFEAGSSPEVRHGACHA